MRCILEHLKPHKGAQLKCIGVKDGQQVMRCPSCGLIECSVDRREEYLKLYKEDSRYFDLVGADYDSFEARFDHDFVVSEARVNNMMRHVLGDPKKLMLLDVGTGNSALLSRAVEHGFKCHGTDLNKWMLERARHLTPQATLHVGDIIGMQFSTKFDVITFIDVFEHFLDPLASAKRVGELLTGAGLVVIETPDIASDGWQKGELKWAHCKPLEHPFLYAEEHIATIFGTAGLKIVDRVYTIPGRCTYYLRRGS